MSECDLNDLNEKDVNRKKKIRKKVALRPITFDEESVPRSLAKELLSQELEAKDQEKFKKKSKKRKKENIISETTHQDETKNSKKMHKKSKSHIDKSDHAVEMEITEMSGENLDDKRKLKKHKKKVEFSIEEETKTEKKETNDEEKSKTPSIREQKRQKHAQLLKDKKVKTELSLQQKSLNYLSKWKHNRSEWKFEKLRQIWLQQNMYDNVKIPDEFWTTLVQYFNNSKGKAKDVLLKDAVEIIEKDEPKSDDEEAQSIKLQRAKDIIQNLEE